MLSGTSREKESLHTLVEWGSIAISFVAFMNDDFEGGQLYFPDHEIAVTPKKGSIVLFPSTYLMPHAVSGIKGNERYVIIGGINLK